MKFEPDWQQSIVDDIEGVLAIIVPVHTNFNIVFGDETNFNIVIKKENGKYYAKVVATKALPSLAGEKLKTLSPYQLYNSAFTNNDLKNQIDDYTEIKVFSINLKNEKTIFYSASGKTVVVATNEPQHSRLSKAKLSSANNQSSNINVVSNAPISEENCIEYYLCTTEFDEDGYIIDYYETYLGRVCGSNGGGGSTGNGTPPVIPEVKNQVTDFCLKKMVDSVLNGSVKNKVALMIDSVFGGTASPDLIIKDTIGLPERVDGRTYGITNSVEGFKGARITLNQTVLTKSSTQFIAATIIHEALHAYMAKYNIIMDAAHEQMAEKYVTVMTNILRSMFPSLSNNHAKSLAWAGLEGTSYFTNPPTGVSIPDNQNDINNDYREKKKGTGCPIPVLID